jgi:hypothetical protein
MADMLTPYDRTDSRPHLCTQGRRAGGDLLHRSAFVRARAAGHEGGPGCHLCLAAVEHQLKAPAVAAARAGAGGGAAALRARRRGLAQAPRVARACGAHRSPLRTRLRRPPRRSVAASAAAGVAGEGLNDGFTHCELAEKGCCKKCAVSVRRAGGGRPAGAPARFTRRGVTTRWPQVCTSPSAVSTTVCRLAAAAATTRFPCAPRAGARAGRVAGARRPHTPTTAHRPASSQAVRGSGGWSGAWQRVRSRRQGQALPPARATLPYPTLGRAAAPAAHLDRLHQARRGV